MINSCVIETKENGTAEVICTIKGKHVDFAVEFEAILRSIEKDPELLHIADRVVIKLMIGRSVIPDCFRPKSDSIEDFINNILKGEKEND